MGGFLGGATTLANGSSPYQYCFSAYPFADSGSPGSSMTVTARAEIVLDFDEYPAAIEKEAQAPSQE